MTNTRHIKKCELCDELMYNIYQGRARFCERCRNAYWRGYHAGYTRGRRLRNNGSA